MTTADPVRIRTADLGPDLLGEWDPNTRTIWLHRDLSPAQRRCTLAHELVHAMRDDEGCHDDVLDAHQETVVRKITARLLISADALADRIAWTLEHSELAEDLAVDVATLYDRLRWLTPAEIEQIEMRIARIERAA